MRGQVTEPLAIVGHSTTCDSDTHFFYEPLVALSDGTYATPMGAGWHEQAVDALAEARTAILDGDSLAIPE